MEPLLNYLAYESKNKMVDLLPWQQQITFPKTFTNTMVNFYRQIQLSVCYTCCHSLQLSEVHLGRYYLIKEQPHKM